MKQGNNKTLVLVGLLLGLVFSELDQTVVSTAMPTIIRDLHGLSLYGWVMGVYLLSITIFMPIIGKLADLYGRRPIYLGCMALFMAGSIVSGLADSMTMLLVGRGIQGIGAGGLMPLALIIIGDTYPLEQRAKIQSVIGPMMILPQLLGPTVGGYLVDHMTWHWIFLINIPIGLVAAGLVAFGIRESVAKEKRSIDWAGATTFALSMLSLLLAPVLIDVSGYSWSSPTIIGLLALSFALIALFIWIESKAKEPIIPLHLFKNRTIVVMSALVFVIMLGVMGGTAAFPFFAQNVMGLTPTASGYMLLSFMAGGVPASIVNGILITKVAYRNLFIFSFVFPIIGFILLSQINIDTSVMYVIVCCFLLGLGLGALFGGDNLIVQESVEKEHSGVALSTVQLFQSLGMTLGFSIFGSLLAKQIRTGVTGFADQFPPGAVDNIETGGIPKGLAPDLMVNVKTVFAESFQNIFTIAIGFAIVAFIICWFMKKEVLSENKETSSVASGTALDLSK
ncbi:MFS transporter [Cohnella sp. NL03-T5]|nr:MFS transporter [Cohnella silvisoli]